MPAFANSSIRTLRRTCAGAQLRQPTIPAKSSSENSRTPAPAAHWIEPWPPKPIADKTNQFDRSIAGNEARHDSSDCVVENARGTSRREAGVHGARGEIVGAPWAKTSLTARKGNLDSEVTSSIARRAHLPDDIGGRIFRFTGRDWA